MTSPRVSVLMPVYNGEKHLGEAIRSILNQTFSDFEYIIVDDGSTDKSRDIIISFDDPRIKMIINEKNIGLTKSLLKGFEFCQGEFLARMDADDISHPQRFQKQVEFLDKNPEIGVLGSNVYAIGENSKTRYKINYPENHSLIKWSLLFSNPMCHPSVSIRKSIINKFGNYIDSDETKYIEEYNLWSRLVHHTKFCNLNEPLLKLRTSGSKISVQNYIKQVNNSVLMSKQNILELTGEKLENSNIQGLWTWKFPSVTDAKKMIEAILITNRRFFEENILTDKEIILINRDTAKRILLITVTKLYSPLMLKYFFKSLQYDKLSIFRTLLWGLKAVINKYLI